MTSVKEQIKVLVAQELCDAGIEALKTRGFEVSFQPKMTRQELLEQIGEYDALIVRSSPMVDEPVYEKAKKMRVVGRAGNGVDNIEMAGATKRGIMVVNTPDANSVSACELTCGMIIAISRNLVRANNTIKSGTWARTIFQGKELNTKTLGIIGLGRIGSLVATRMQSFGMKVIAYDPYITDARFEKYNAEKKHTLHELLSEADIITVHTPKTEETFGMVGSEQLKYLKPGVRIVNCARGGIVSEETLKSGLESGLIAAAACDVMVQEPCLDSPLYKFDNFIITPHIGANTDEAQENVGLTVAQEVAAALSGEMVPNAVNLPVLSPKGLSELLPYMKLAEMLGKLYHQMEKQPIEKIEITYGGVPEELETEMLTLAVLRGVFEPVLKEQVNYVNAKLVADSRGIKVSEIKESNGHKYTTIGINIYASGNKYNYVGGITGDMDLIITDINGFHFDLHPAEFMLVVENVDAPGMIGRMGMTLGEHDINIANMQVARNALKKAAIMIMTVDSEIGAHQLKQISVIDGIRRASFIKL